MAYRMVMIPAALISLFLLVGCATVPERLPGEYYIGMMPEESSYLIKIDVKNNRSLTELLFAPVFTDDTLPPRLLDRISSAYMGGKSAVGPSSVFTTPSVSLAATGQFPAGIISMNLDKENEWEKVTNHGTYWFNKTLSVELALPERTLLCLSTENVSAMVRRYNERETLGIPEEVRREFDISDVVIYLPNPGADMFAEGGGGMSGGFGANLPIDAVWITLFSPVDDTDRPRADDGNTSRVKAAPGNAPEDNENDHELSYDVSLVFKVADPSKTKQLVLLSRLFIVSLMRKAEIGDISRIKDEVTITEGGDRVRIEGLELTVSEIARGMESLSFGSAAAGNPLSESSSQ